jgi:hypothetical protein
MYRLGFNVLPVFNVRFAVLRPSFGKATAWYLNYSILLTMKIVDRDGCDVRNLIVWDKAWASP